MILLLITMGILLTIMSTVAPEGSLDARFYYTSLEAQTFLKSLSLQGLTNYRLNEFLDLFFIYKYTRALGLSLTRLFPGKKLWMLIFIPASLDLLETSVIIAALSSAHQTLFLSQLGVVTAAKWITVLSLTAFTVWSLFLRLKKSA